MRRRVAGMAAAEAERRAAPPPQPIEEEPEPDTFFDNPYKPPETARARFTGTEPKQTTETVAPGEKTKANNEELSTDQDDSQALKLTQHCAYVTINDQLTNCHTINWTQKALLAIVNFNIGSYGYATISFEQLALWLGAGRGTIKNMINELEKLQFMEDLGRCPGGKHRLAIPQKWRNPKKKAKPSDDNVPF